MTNCRETLLKARDLCLSLVLPLRLNAVEMHVHNSQG